MKRLLALTLMTGTVLAGDGSDESGFVPPPSRQASPATSPSYFEFSGDARLLLVLSRYSADSNGS